MGCSKVPFGVFALAAILLGIAFPAAVQAQSEAPAPAPKSDGTTIDQGIAYILMFVALVLTYLFHTADFISY